MSDKPHPTVNKAEFAKGILPEGRLAPLVRAAAGLGNTNEDWSLYVAGTANGFPNEGEFRLFPLVAERLGDIETVERSVWLSESVGWAKARSRRIQAAQDFITPILEEEGIRVIWTKGTALAGRVYPRHELRPSSDLDAICNWEDLPRLAELAARNGWEQKAGKLGTAGERRYTTKEFGWYLPGEVNIDFSWMPRTTFVFDRFLIDRLMDEAANSPGWTSYAGPDWLLIEAIEHGLMANKVWPIRWLVDAIEIMRTAMLDWDFILEVSLRYKIEAIMRCGLETIAEFMPGVPDHVLTELALKKHDPLARDELRARVSVVDLTHNTITNRRYNLMRRAPSRIYREITTTPFSRWAGQSLRLRTTIAARNLWVRTRWPLGTRLPD